MTLSGNDRNVSWLTFFSTQYKKNTLFSISHVRTNNLWKPMTSYNTIASQNNRTQLYLARQKQWRQLTMKLSRDYNVSQPPMSRRSASQLAIRLNCNNCNCLATHLANKPIFTRQFRSVNWWSQRYQKNVPLHLLQDGWEHFWWSWDWIPKWPDGISET